VLQATNTTQAAYTNPVAIDELEFHQLIAKRSLTLLCLAKYLSQCSSRSEFLIRAFLGELLSQSMQLEELLDAYNARNNCRWCTYRSLTAALKLFSDVSYELLHIQHVLPAYRLLPIESDFVKATDDAIAFTSDVLVRAANQILAKATELDMPSPCENLREKSYSEHLPPGRLPYHCAARRAETVSDIVTLLTTAFLNLAAESQDVRAASRAKPEEYHLCITASVTEERLRGLELRFHNLQSLYDTHVSGTEAENIDTDLPVLRGHISVVFHLFRTATMFAHYYERHINRQPCAFADQRELLVDPNALLGVLMKYSIAHINQYIDCAEQLCRAMLKRYAEVGQVDVPIPRYRGLHVRPATLIAKLVLHYGSEVQMRLDQDTYDAGSPLDLFRANEKINAQKRRWLTAEISNLNLVPDNAPDTEIKTIAREVVFTLAEKHKLILYEQRLYLPTQPAEKQGTTLAKVIAEVSQLLMLGKIDVDTQLTATFVGDKRVLADIKLLAESGYGEDNFGNNITLPEKLAYLRR